MQQGVVGQRAVGADPQALDRVPGLVLQGQLADVALVDRVGAGEPVGESSRDRARAGRATRAASRARAPRASATGGRRPLLVDVERRRQVEDGPAVLDGDHPPGRERSAVADAVHLVEDGHVGVPGAQEVGVERVRRGPRSTVRPAAIRAWAATWPPNTRWRSSSGLTPRKMLTSMGSRSRRSTRKSRASLTTTSCQAPTATVSLCRTTTFPEGFLWGTATAAHQIEGGNINNDWWAFEHDPGRRVSSRAATRATRATACPRTSTWSPPSGLGAYRFSLEWSRIEPAEGEFSGRVPRPLPAHVRGCHERGLSPVVTFHHFTIPRWLSERGGWEATTPPSASPGSASGSVAHLGDLVGWACTLNEPNVVATMGWRLGIFPPRVRDRGRRRAVNAALCRAHVLGVEALRGGRATSRSG